MSAPQRVTMDAIYELVTGGHSPDGDTTTTLIGICRRLGREPGDDEVASMVAAMNVSGFLRRDALGAYHRGPTRFAFSQAHLDRRFAARIDASQAAGTLVTHSAEQACSLGLWHEGACPDRDLEKQLHDDDVAQDNRGLLPWQRRTCEVHRGWMADCALDPAHLAEDSHVLDWAGKVKHSERHEPHNRRLLAQADAIRRKRQPPPEKNPYTGTMDVAEFMPNGNGQSLAELIEAHRWLAHNNFEEHLAGNSTPGRDYLDDALFWHAVADALDRRVKGLPDVDQRGRPKPSGVPEGVE